MGVKDESEIDSFFAIDILSFFYWICTGTVPGEQL